MPVVTNVGVTANCGEALFVKPKDTTVSESFGIVSPEIAYSIIGVLILGIAIVARRIKKSAPKDFSGEELVAPDALISRVPQLLHCVADARY